MEKQFWVSLILALFLSLSAYFLGLIEDFGFVFFLVIPIIYLPYLWFSFNVERKTFFLMLLNFVLSYIFITFFLMDFGDYFIVGPVIFLLHLVATIVTVMIYLKRKLNPVVDASRENSGLQIKDMPVWQFILLVIFGIIMGLVVIVGFYFLLKLLLRAIF